MMGVQEEGPTALGKDSFLGYRTLMMLLRTTTVYVGIRRRLVGRDGESSCRSLTTGAGGVKLLLIYRSS